MPPKTRSAGPKSQPRVRYREASDDEAEILSVREGSSRPRRSVRYRDDTETESEVEVELPIRQVPPPSTTSPAKRNAPARKSLASQAPKRKRKGPGQLGQPKKARAASKEPENAINFQLPAGARHPPWSTLPYQVLLSIFQFSAYPLIDSHWNRRETVAWLAKSSRVCKSFLEPALAALYHGPPISHPVHYDAFRNLIAREGTIVDYRSKVHQLDFECGQYKFEHCISTFDDLIQKLLGLKSFGIHDIADEPQPISFQSRSVNAKSDIWYQYDWVDSLANINLTRFKFHAMAIHPTPSTMFDKCFMRDGVVRSAFNHLQTLEIAGLDYAGQKHGNMALLQQLPALVNLIFTRCDFLYRLEPDNTKSPLDCFFLDQLPETLRSLEFKSCPHLESPDLLFALRRSGQNLKSLKLRSNRSISLEFLTDLAEVCPSLEVLVYDLALYSSSLVTMDVQPYFEQLLGPDDIPRWPKSLQKLELNQLRNWDVQASEGFFKSLLESAASLPDLRKLWITASVDSGWRERVKLREQIISPLIYAYSRLPDAPSGPPSRRSASPRLGSRGKKAELPVQGKCDEVHIRMDNLRPVEDQKTEEDFLDSEQSGDDNYVD